MSKLGVVGAGTMGAGIAFVLASRLKEPVVVRDVSDEALARGKKAVERYAARAVEKAGARREEVDEWLGRIGFTTDLGGLAGSDVVVEAVFESLDLKQETFRALEGICPPGAILASNTSGLSITRIASAVKRRGRVIGMHFFNPAPVMRLVELIKGYETAPETVEKARALCASLGKETVVANDYPGFITTRIGQALIAEGIRCLEQGVGTAEDIDKGVRLAYNYPMGPLELADLIGLDVQLHIQEFMHAEMGETFRPSPLLKQLVASGHLGRKTGRGFYGYEKR